MLEPAAGQCLGWERRLTAGSTRGSGWGRERPQPSLSTEHKPCWGRAQGLPSSLGVGRGTQEGR